MPSQALQDPRDERAANGEYREGRDCPVCWGDLATPTAIRGRQVRQGKRFCSTRCRMFAWRRGGDPDGDLDFRRQSR